MKKTGVQYIKCPRCELNYIQKKDKFCDVCKSEMKAGILKESDMEELEMLEEGMELCPICKVNYINPGEHMCVTCQEEQIGDVKDDEPDWRGFVEKDDSDEELDLLPVEDDEIDEELEGAFAEDLDESDFDDEDEDEESDSIEEDDDFDSSDDFGDDFDDEDDEDDEDEDDDEDLY